MQIGETSSSVNSKHFRHEIQKIKLTLVLKKHKPNFW